MNATPSTLCEMSLVMSARQPDGGRRTPDGHRQQQIDDVDHDDGRPYSATDGDAHTGGASTRVVAVVAMHQDHQDREHQHLAERPEHVSGWQEQVEVMVVRARALPVERGDGESGREV